MQSAAQSSPKRLVCSPVNSEKAKPSFLKIYFQFWEKRSEWTSGSVTRRNRNYSSLSKFESIKATFQFISGFLRGEEQKNPSCTIIANCLERRDCDFETGWSRSLTTEKSKEWSGLIDSEDCSRFLGSTDPARTGVWQTLKYFHSGRSTQESTERAKTDQIQSNGKRISDAHWTLCQISKRFAGKAAHEVPRGIRSTKWKAAPARRRKSRVLVRRKKNVSLNKHIYDWLRFHTFRY